MTLTPREIEFCKILKVHDGFVRRNTMPVPYKLYIDGLVTEIHVLESGATEIKEKNKWWNRKKGTIEFVNILRSKAVHRTNSHARGWRSDIYVALTPLGYAALGGEV